MKIKKFAKIENSLFQFNDLTVLVGKPSTNKSYIMKFKYCIDETFASINSKKFLKLITFMDNKEEMQFLNFVSNLLELKNIDIKKFIQDLDFRGLKNKLEENDDKMALDVLNKLILKQEKIMKFNNQEKFKYLFKNILYSIFRDPNQISDFFEVNINDNLIKFENNEFHFDIKNFMDIKNTVFVETPLILEFEKFLPKDIASTPYHIDSLLQILKEENFSFFDDEEEIFIREFLNKTTNIIKGNILKDNSNLLYKNSNGNVFNIVNTSSGVKSIGLLQYLVKNRVLKKGTILFWEEPEVHLHPQWQVKIAQLFLFLVEKGVKIVISTHSPLITNTLKIFAKKELKNKVSFNLLKENESYVENIVLDDTNWDLIQDELLNPLEELAWEYI